MITVKYSCSGCGIVDRDVQVVARGSKEDIGEWMQNKLTPAVSVDHSITSPQCEATKMDNVKIPMTGSDKIGAEPRAKTGATAPSVMFIEMAMDMLKTMPADLKADELSELNELGPGRLQELGVKEFNQPDDFSIGYLLGMETARAILAGMPAAVFNGVSI